MFIGTAYDNYSKALLSYNNSVFGISASPAVGNSYFSSLLNVGSSKASADTYFNSSGLKYVMSIREGGAGLNAAISSLAYGAFGKSVALSSDTDALAVIGGSNQYAYNAGSETKIQVDQVAAGQTNVGTALQADEQSSIAGRQEFSIEINGRTYKLSIDVADGDTNKDVQQKMAAAINKKNIGIDATVDVNSANGTSTLQLSAQSTGLNDKSSFSISDVSGSAVAKTGAAKVTQQAKNAVYSINGGANQTSQNNTVKLNNGVIVALKQATVDPVVISQGMDTDFVRSQVESFVKNYNRLYGAALENAKDPKASGLASQIVNTSKAYAYSLAQIGIGFDSNGYMRVDEAQFKAAGESGKVEQFFTQNRNTNYGFTNQLSHIAEQVQANTINYISSGVFIDSLLGDMNFSFYNSMGTIFQSVGISGTGLLFSFLM